MLDLRAVVGPGKRTLLLGYVREWGQQGDLQGVKSFMGGPVEDPFIDSTKKSSGGCRGERIINRSVVSSLGKSANPVTMEAFRDSKVLWWVLLRIHCPLHPLGY